MKTYKNYEKNRKIRREDPNVIQIRNGVPSKSKNKEESKNA